MKGAGVRVRVEVEEGIGWVILNRPEKRNAMSPTLNLEMREVLDNELDEAVKVLVLTGAGESWTAGMDMKEYFREVDRAPEFVQEKIRRDGISMAMEASADVCETNHRDGERVVLRGRVRASSGMRSGYSVRDRVFGLSEINWGIPPGNLVSKALADTVGHRKALEYIMTGETFTGLQAAEMGLVNRAVPLEILREETVTLARKLASKNPIALRAAKHAFKRCRELTWEQSEDYLYAKVNQALLRDHEKGREKGLQQFLDEKSFKPGLENYRR